MLKDLHPFDRREHAGEAFMNGVSGVHDGDTRHTDAQQETQADQLDDVFGSVPSSPNLTAHDSAQERQHGTEHSDIPRLRSIHVTNGYREGIAASKETHMQDGFDEGYSLGAELGLKVGWCLGALEGMLRAMLAKSTAQSDLAEKAQLDFDEATRELDVSHLCGKDYFGEDGIWLYNVPSESPSFEDIAAAHPVLQKWAVRVHEQAGVLGLEFRGTVGET